MSLEVHCCDETTPTFLSWPISAQHSQTADRDSLCLSVSKQALPLVAWYLIKIYIYKNKAVAVYFLTATTSEIQYSIAVFFYPLCYTVLTQCSKQEKNNEVVCFSNEDLCIEKFGKARI